MIKKAIQTLKHYLRVAGYVRWSRALMAVVLVLSLYIPIFLQISDIKAYALTPGAQKVLGSANKNLSAKFTYDAKGSRWQFNKSGVASLASDIAKQQGGKDTEGIAGALSQVAAKQVGGSGKNDTSLYSVDLPVKAQEGITYFDNVTRLSFKMVPTYKARDAKLVDHRIVYPVLGGGQIVYTAMANGLKEDIVLPEYIDNTLRYSYTLELPDTLEARILDDGSIGIYSANPALFGDISFNTDEDRSRVMEGRKNGDKNHLVFGIPAPVIKDQDGKAGHTRYELKGKTLTVVASELKDLHYPLSVDPSVTVTSSSDFQTGDNEGMISFTTAGQVSRGTIRGGTLGAWHFTDNSVDRGTTQNAGSGAANGMIAARNAHALVAYNDYLYAIGGDTQGTSVATIERAPINSNGTLGTWVSSGSLPEARADHVAFAYNGYMYVVGGYTGGGSYSTDVKFAAISSSDGSLGTWAATTSLPVGRTNHAAFAYSGMMYVINGCTTAAGQCNSANPTAVVYCASMLATGQVGTWNTCNSSGLVGTDGFSAVAYNGYVYGAGGCSVYSLFACTTIPRYIQTAKINSDGSLGNWSQTSLLYTTDRGEVNLVVNNGYLYITGDSGTDFVNDMQYASINANGAIGEWTATASYTTTRNNGALAVYKGYAYMAGGCTARTAGQCSNTLNGVQYTPIDIAGVIGSFVTETDTIETDGLMHSAAVAYKGFLYLVGGMNGPSMSNSVTTVYYTALNADGSTGAWSTTSSFNAQRGDVAALAYNGYMYMLGGQHTTADTSCSPAANLYCTDVQKAVINSDGTLGAWSSAGGDYSTTGRASLGAAAYNGYIYAFGGVYSNNSLVSSETTVGQIQPNGNITGWTTTGSLVTGIESVGVAQYGQYLFAIAGRTGGVNFNNVVQYAVLNNSGTVTWGSTNAFTTGRANFMTGVYNGYVYISGGTTGTGTNNVSDTQYARICQTTATTDGCNGTIGTLGTWHTTNSFTTTRGAHTGTIYNGYLYIMGGCTNWGLFGACASSAALLNDLQYAKINNGGAGNTTAWTTQGSSGVGRGLNGGATYNDYLYIAGGCTGGIDNGIMSCSTLGMQSDVRYATMNDDGTTTAWASAGSDFTTARSGLATVAYNGYLYVLGGCSATSSGNCTTFKNDVQYAPINANGTIGAWATTNAFTTGRYGLSAVVNNGYLYVLGGCSAVDGSANCTGFQNDVQKALICTGSNSGTGGCGSTAGTVGTWSSAGTGFTTGRLYQSAVVNGGYLYVFGGCSAMASGKDCTTFRNDVQSIALNTTDGTLSGSWLTTTSFPTARYGASAVAYNGFVYVIGGCSAHSGSSCTAKIDNVMFAPLGSGGVVGNWTHALQKWTTDSGRFLGAAVVAKGYLAMLNGIDSSSAYITTQQTTPINVQSRVGKYSKLVSVNPTTSIAGVYYSGSLDGGSSVNYRVAPSSGIFGATTAATQGTGSEPTPLCGNGSIYYVQLLITIGDLTNALQADDNISNVTDVTIYYRLNATPTPNLRLNGGKWFYSEAQQPLDICKQ